MVIGYIIIKKYKNLYLEINTENQSNMILKVIFKASVFVYYLKQISIRFI